MAPLTLQTSSLDVEHFPMRAALTPTSASVNKVAALPTIEPPLPAHVSMVSSVAAVPPPPAPVITATTFKKSLKLSSNKNIIDPVVLGIELEEPLYVGAPHSTQKSIETAAAQKLEGQLDTLYKNCCGRSRGWTKVGIEAMLKPRCASGGDLKELDRAKKAFIWSLATDDKPLSAFLDFVCAARRIRCVIMNSEKKTAHLYPAADRLDDDGKALSYPMYFVDDSGHKINGLSGAAELLEFIEKMGWTLLPPESVVHTLSGLKLDELESVGLKLGMTVVEGKKCERITAIASFKTMKRLK